MAFKEKYMAVEQKQCDIKHKDGFAFRKYFEQAWN